MACFMMTGLLIATMTSTVWEAVGASLRNRQPVLNWFGYEDLVLLTVMAINVLAQTGMGVGLLRRNTQMVLGSLTLIPSSLLFVWWLA